LKATSDFPEVVDRHATSFAEFAPDHPAALRSK
jgi:hypothetical protein